MEIDKKFEEYFRFTFRFLEKTSEFRLLERNGEIAEQFLDFADRFCQKAQSQLPLVGYNKARASLEILGEELAQERKRLEESQKAGKVF